MSSKTQRGFIGGLIIVIGLVAVIGWGILHLPEMHGCLSQTGSCFKRAAAMSVDEMIVEMLMCVVNTTGCIVESVCDMVVSWVHQFF